MNFHSVETTTIVDVPDRFDSNIAYTFEKELKGLIDSGHTAILCDFSRTNYISSAGLRVLLATMKKTKAVNGRFGVFSVSPFVMEVFDVSGFSRVIPIYPSQDDAIRDKPGDW